MREKIKQNKNQIIIYRTKSGLLELQADIIHDTFWLTQQQVADIFDVQKAAISKHAKNIFDSDELEKKSTVSKMETVQIEGDREIKRRIEYYNLDLILSIGYRVNSKKATLFRQWATKVLRDHITKGFTINERRLKEKEQAKLSELQRAIHLLQNATQSKKVGKSEALGLLQVITDYANSWVALHDYDEGKIQLKKSRKASFVFDYEQAKNNIEELKKKLTAKKKATDIFGIERESGLKSILGNIVQSFSGKDLYPSIEEKAAHLLYFVIKDHPFVDGNKRIAAFLFVLFLSKNNFLFDKNGERKINDNALVAIALLVAQSDPREKDVMIKIITNMVSG
jgi:death-on-curing family protein